MAHETKQVARSPVLCLKLPAAADPPDNPDWAKGAEPGCRASRGRVSDSPLATDGRLLGPVGLDIEQSGDPASALLSEPPSSAEAWVAKSNFARTAVWPTGRQAAQKPLLLLRVGKGPSVQYTGNSFLPVVPEAFVRVTHFASLMAPTNL